jgi:hypothetical protein
MCSVPCRWPPHRRDKYDIRRLCSQSSSERLIPDVIVIASMNAMSRNPADLRAPLMSRPRQAASCGDLGAAGMVVRMDQQNAHIRAQAGDP